MPSSSSSKQPRSSWRILPVALWLFGSSMLLVTPVSASYTLTIQPGEEECFYVRTPKNEVVFIAGSYDCIDDDVEARDLSVSISNPDTGEIIFESPKGRREGTFQLDSTVVKANTRYGLCFQNSEKADDDEKENEFDVGFSIHVTKAPRTLKDEEIGPDGERALQLVSKATRIQQDWTNLMDHYEYVRNREGVHQDMNDAILSRLSRWNTMEALVVIGMATGQVMYWKRFFETKRYL